MPCLCVNLFCRDLARNQLIGEIPRLIYWNEVLQYLGLRGNSLTGTLSPDMCQLTGLWYFDVRGNNLTGTILITLAIVQALRSYLWGDSIQYWLSTSGHSISARK
ncbi:LRR receptor-like serine/threonine-protein kinase ERL2 [Camellia lanceoleosa]|uniref:LRR receptor-like serine/threonine-protein kinase ERL2 n=1 Tax=Camellia lanceoleosa TaxID=1840588 RepID=A0ACC0HMK4_9ERIC|nr:LRR receptor-like serine/threonine-protein kinase ERL2 [Camellia lanceoleosa]